MIRPGSATQNAPLRSRASPGQFGRQHGLIDLDKPHAFAWSCGIPYLFTLEERYELAGTMAAPG
jgi:hypothetical protein